MNTSSIENKLLDEEGFKPLFKGLFSGGKVKKSHNIYLCASKKGVYPLHKVRSASHEDTKYAIYAFSPEGEVPQESLALITERCANLSLGTIRYECISYTRLQEWRGEKGSAAASNVEITGIAPECPEVLVFPVAYEVDCTYVIYAFYNDEHHVYPITEKQAAAISG